MNKTDSNLEMPGVYQFAILYKGYKAQKEEVYEPLLSNSVSGNEHCYSRGQSLLTFNNHTELHALSQYGD